MNPVTLHVDRNQPPARIHVLIRLLLLVAMGALGLSSIYWLLYLALPAVAAALISQKGADRYLDESLPAALPFLRSVAGFYSYLWLLTDEFPTTIGSLSAHFEVVPRGAPTVTSALLRLITSLPALLILAVMSMVAAFLWVVGALSILIARKLPAFVSDFIAMTLRLQFRLAAYHLSFVECYPPPMEALAHPLPHEVPRVSV
jgi:hypothetical protein